MDRWEYSVETVAAVDDTSAIARCSASGWELFSIRGRPGKYFVTFKRLRAEVKASGNVETYMALAGQG
jgi:hypothetical protein